MKSEVTKLFSIQKCLAEFLGTFGVVFFGCGALTIHAAMPGSVDLSAVPLIFGAIVTTMIYTFGHISGAHFNPAVSLGFVVARHFLLKEMWSYWVAQFLGAILAIAILKILVLGAVDFGATHPHIEVWRAFLWEAVLTFFLMLVIMAVATDTRAVGVIAGIAIGLSVALDAYVGGPLTGASLNPARSLAPALFEGDLSNLSIYFAGPILGAVLAAIFYQWIRCDQKDEGQDSPKAAKGCC